MQKFCNKLLQNFANFRNLKILSKINHCYQSDQYHGKCIKSIKLDKIWKSDRKKKHIKSFCIRELNTMHKKDLKFALVVELLQLKFTYIMVLKWPKLGHKEQSGKQTVLSRSSGSWLALPINCLLKCFRHLFYFLVAGLNGLV